MTNENENGTNKLAQRIISDAERDAAATEADCAATVARMRAESDAAVDKKRAEYQKARDIAVAGVIDGCRTRASIEGRKSALAKKRAVMNGVFEQAYQALLGKQSDVRGAVCARMLEAEAEGGETVRPAAADRASIAAKAALIAERRLTIGADDCGMEGGFLLVGDSYEKDCSFASLMRELRGAEETAVAKLLFD